MAKIENVRGGASGCTASASGSENTIQNLQFQVLEICTRTKKEFVDASANANHFEPLIELYGVTDVGDSVLCRIGGHNSRSRSFYPYFFVENLVIGNADILEVENRLEHQLQEQMDESVFKGPRPIPAIRSLLPSPSLKSVIGYRVDELQSRSPIIKVEVQLPNVVTSLRSLLSKKWGLTTYESDVPFILRFMLDTGVCAGAWIEVERRCVTKPESLCSIEVEVLDWKMLRVHRPDEKEWSRVAAFRIMSFDIECASKSGNFPVPETDSVVQIACVLAEHGKEATPLEQCVFVLGDCDQINNTVTVHTTSTETDLLEAWAEYMRQTDPDLVIGYNTSGFDFPFLMNRAKTLGMDKNFFNFGRLRYSPAKLEKNILTTKMFGTRETYRLIMAGRLQIDILEVIRREHKLRSYTLNAVSAKFLDEQKEEVEPSQITPLHHGSSADRSRLAKYCWKDAILPLRLYARLMIGVNAIEMARTTGVPIGFLFNRGQQVKVAALLMRFARPEGLLIPRVEVEHETMRKGIVSYKGATVIDPVCGFHRTPRPTLDFASLYPSIMQAHNLCYSTLVLRNEPKNSPKWINRLKQLNLHSTDVEVSPTNDTFVKCDVKRGLLPQVLEILLTRRREAKRQLAASNDQNERAVLEGRQLSLKVVANSVYGFTGAEFAGKLPEIAISRSVTSYGRQMLEITRKVVQEHYCPKNGYEYKACIVYGDTDSVMVNFGDIPLSRAIELGKDAADRVTHQFIPPIKLEFEKVYLPYLLVSKKRYAGLLWYNADGPPRLDMKGLEAVRRDNCPLVQKLVLKSLELILRENKIEEAKQLVRDVCTQLVKRKVSISDLIISKGISRPPAQYKSKQPHLELATKIERRDPARAPRVGDRVPYVFISGVKGQPAYQRSEDPVYAMEHNLSLDTVYYIENQLKKPITRIFKQLMDNTDTLFVGNHMRHVVQTTSTEGIARFFTVKARCSNCKFPVEHTGRTLCNGCNANTNTRKRSRNQLDSDIEDLTKLLRTCENTCQTCQENSGLEIICRNRDCPTFYTREQTRTQLNRRLAQQIGIDENQ